MITQTFPALDYDAAKTYARELVKTYGRDAGILKTREFNTTVFRVSFLPKKENCFGEEMRAERVSQGD